MASVEDTSPAAEARYRELLAQAGPMRRLEIFSQLTMASRELALAGIKRESPEASPLELRARLAERLYGSDVRKRLFPEVE